MLTVTLSPAGVEVAMIASGGVVRSARRPIPEEHWSEIWDADLRPLDAMLSEALSELGVGSTAATVYYHGPKSQIELSTVHATRREAIQAAKLGIADSLEAQAERSCVAAWPAGGQTGSPTVLGFGDSESSILAIDQWLGRAGCTLDSAIPIGAAAVMRLAETIGQISQPLAIAYLDFDCTAIAASVDGQIAFVRTVEFGYSQLAEGFARGLRRSSGKTAPGLSPSTPRELLIFEGLAPLLKDGIPSYRSPYPGLNRDQASAIIALLSPVLQRYAIELKQTARFGLPRSVQTQVRLVLTGPGASIPGLAEFISDIVEIPVESIEDLHPGLSDTPASGSPSNACTQGPRLGPGLIPRHEAMRRRGRCQTRAAVAGVLLALVGVGSEYSFVNRALARAQITSHAVQKQIEIVRDRHEKVTRGNILQDEIASAGQIIDQALGGSPSWSAVLIEVALAAPAELELHEITGDMRNGDAILTVVGQFNAQSSGDDSNPLQSFVAKLQESPLTQSVGMGSIRMVGGDGMVQVFTLHATLRPLGFGLAELAEAAHEEAGP